MKRLIFILALICSFSSCKEHTHEIKDKQSNNELNDIYQYDKLEGTYEGDFGGSGDIKIILRHITGTHAVGYNLHKGLRRNISGKMNTAGNSFRFYLLEPGDNPYDGEFTFEIDTATFKLTGSWKPLNNSKLSAKTFTLHKIARQKDTVEKYVEMMNRVMYDSLGAEYDFEENGLVIYRYYPDPEDKSATQQYEEIKGNWKKTATEYIIEWQKNDRLPNQRSIFKIVPYPEIEDAYYLEGEGKKIQPRLAG